MFVSRSSRDAQEDQGTKALVLSKNTMVMSVAQDGLEEAGRTGREKTGSRVTLDGFVGTYTV